MQLIDKYSHAIKWVFASGGVLYLIWAVWFYLQTDGAISDELFSYLKGVLVSGSIYLLLYFNELEQNKHRKNSKGRLERDVT